MRTSLPLLIVLSLWPRPADSQDAQRRWLPEPVLSATITDQSGDLFGDPWTLISDPGGGFLIVEAATIRAFHVDGARRWSAGRSGRGPGEFTVIEDVKVTPDGRVLALDREQPRVTAFDAASGEFIATVLLRREVARTRPHPAGPRRPGAHRGEPPRKGRDNLVDRIGTGSRR